MEKIKEWCETAFYALPITLKMLVVFGGFMCVAMVWSGIRWLAKKALKDKPPKEGTSLTGRK